MYALVFLQMEALKGMDKVLASADLHNW
jgi:hypothetical protein